MKEKGKIVYCPTCGNEVHFCLDGYGRTPWHLHCNFCGINIGAASCKKAHELLLKHNKPLTYIEYYKNEIKYMVEDGKEIINKE